MRILSISVENFGPLNGEHSVDLANINATTVSGPNEAGKSSLFIDAPLFALFGKARERPEGLIYDLANTMKVTLDFLHGKHRYVVERSIKRGKKQATQSLKLSQDGKDISERLPSATQTKLENELGFSYELLLSTAVAQQDEVNKLSTMGASDRERILNEMLNIEHWEVKKKAVADILNEHKDLNKNIQEKETELVVIKQQIEEYSQKIEHIQEKELIPSNALLSLLQIDFNYMETEREEVQVYEKLVNNFNVLAMEVKGLKEQVDNLPKDDGIQEQIDQLNKTRVENIVLAKEAEEYSKVLQKKSLDLSDEITAIRNLISIEPTTTILKTVPCVGLDIHDKCELLNNALQNKGKIDNFLKNYIDEDLPLLLRSTLDKKAGVDKEITEIVESSAFIHHESSMCAVKINNLVKVSDVIRKGQEVLERYEVKSKELEQLRTQRVSPKTLIFDSDRYKEIGNKLHDLRNKIQVSQLQLMKLETEKITLEKNKEIIAGKLYDLKIVETSLADYKTLHTAYNDIPTMLFEEAIPTVEQYTNEILQKISPEKTVQLRSFKENKNGSVQKALDVVSMQSTGTRDFKDLSGSAKFRQSLAMRIALARYNREKHNIEIDFFICDEGFGSLDNDNVYLMKNMLRDIASHFDLFIMISHIEELKDVFDTQIIINGPGKVERIQVKNG